MSSMRTLTALLGAAMLATGCASGSAAGSSASAAPAPAAGFAYRPGTLRYRSVVSTVASQEMMGQKMTDSGTVNRLVSVTLAPRGGDTLAITYRIDSISTTTTNPQAKQLVAGQQGKSLAGTISPLGGVYALDLQNADSAQAMLRLALDSYRYFLPRVPSRAVKVGDSWADTVRQKFDNAGISGGSTLIVTSRVVGDTTVGGRAAWRVERMGNVTIEGSGDQGGQPLTLEGKGTVNGSSFLSPNGIYLGADETQNMDITVQAPGMGLTIPISQKIRSHTELVSGG